MTDTPSGREAAGAWERLREGHRRLGILAERADLCDRAVFARVRIR